MFAFKVLIFVAGILASSATNNHKISFIIDFLKFQSKPTETVVWDNCFAIDEKIELVKSSSRNFKPILFNRQDVLKGSDFRVNPHFLLFIADLTCAESPENVIKKVKENEFFQGGGHCIKSVSRMYQKCINFDTLLIQCHPPSYFS